MTIEEKKNNPFVIAVSGLKNSGKTRLIIKIISHLAKTGMKIAFIKHDGHQFEPDVQGTDSYQCLEAGAIGTAVFSDACWMMVKKEKIDAEYFVKNFSHADLIIIEGLKFSKFPKFEIRRKEIKEEYPICNPNTVLAYISDFSYGDEGEKAIFHPDDIEGISKFIIDKMPKRG